MEEALGLVRVLGLGVGQLQLVKVSDIKGLHTETYLFMLGYSCFFLKTNTVVSCGPPPSVSNGSFRMPTSITFGGVVTYSCDAGYQLSGSATVTCQASGSWSGIPICTGKSNFILTILTTFQYDNCTVVSCGVPPDISSGTRTFTGTTFGETAMYSCNNGFALAGSVTITCQASGEWENEPSCTLNGIAI